MYLSIPFDVAALAVYGVASTSVAHASCFSGCSGRHLVAMLCLLLAWVPLTCHVALQLTINTVRGHACAAS